MADYYTINPFNRKASLAVSPIDCYRGAAVAGDNINVVVKGGFKRALVKSSGFYVFNDLPDGIWEFSILSKDYFRETIAVDTSISDLIVKVNIVPNRNYRLPQGSTFVDGSCAAGTKVYAIPLGEGGLVKFQKYSDGVITVRTGMDLSNQILAFYENGELDIFETDEMIRKNTYGLRRGFSKEYRAGSEIFPVSLGISDESGYLFCPIRGFYEGRTEILIKTERSNEIFYKRFNIKYGKGNSINVI